MFHANAFKIRCLPEPGDYNAISIAIWRSTDESV